MCMWPRPKGRQCLEHLQFLLHCVCRGRWHRHMTHPIWSDRRSCLLDWSCHWHRRPCRLDWYRHRWSCRLDYWGLHCTPGMPNSLPLHCGRMHIRHMELQCLLLRPEQWSQRFRNNPECILGHLRPIWRLALLGKIIPLEINAVPLVVERTQGIPVSNFVLDDGRNAPDWHCGLTIATSHQHLVGRPLGMLHPALSQSEVLTDGWLVLLRS